jgi:hypothetical protein
MTMTAKQMLLFLFLGCFFIGNVNAAPVTINANDYAPGTDISNAINGVTLQNYYHADFADNITYGPVLIDSVSNFYADSFYEPAGNYISVSQDTIRLSNVLGGEPLSSSRSFFGLSITSDNPISTFAFDAFGGAGDDILILLFDKNDTYIGTQSVPYSSYTPYDGTPDWTYPAALYNYSENLSNQAVYRIAVGSWGSTAFLGSLTVESVPEPSGLVLLGIGLLGIGIFNKRKIWSQLFVTGM